MAVIDQAKKLGFVMERAGKEHRAVLSKRGRALPLVVTVAETAEKAAQMAVDYMKKGKK